MKGRSRKVPKDIDEYLMAVPKDARAALERLRRTIRAAAPDAAETISYGMPAFKYLGPLVGFAAFKDHCSLFPMSSSVIEAHKGELKRYSTSKGTIRFPANRPPPSSLVKELVRERLRENEARAEARARRKSGTAHRKT